MKLFPCSDVAGPTSHTLRPKVMPLDSGEPAGRRRAGRPFAFPPKLGGVGRRHSLPQWSGMRRTLLTISACRVNRWTRSVARFPSDAPHRATRQKMSWPCGRVGHICWQNWAHEVSRALGRISCSLHCTRLCWNGGWPTRWRSRDLKGPLPRSTVRAPRPQMSRPALASRHPAARPDKA